MLREVVKKCVVLQAYGWALTASSLNLREAENLSIMLRTENFIYQGCPRQRTEKGSSKSYKKQGSRGHRNTVMTD